MTIAPGIFRQYDIRGVVGDDLTPEVAAAIGRGYAAYIRERGIDGAIAVGRDNRPSGERLHAELVGALLESGVDVVDIGVVPTPLLYWSLSNLDVAGGIQITGSHNPPEYNGFKLCVGRESLHGEGIVALRKLIDGGRFPSGQGTLRRQEIIDRYIDDIASRVGPIRRRVRVAID
jgi:phosphomannomutase/phosphoglucomutase